MNKNIDFELSTDNWDVKGAEIEEDPQRMMNFNRVYFSRSIKLSSENTRDVYRTWGLLYSDLGDYPKSLIKLRKALAMEPDSVEIIKALGKCLNALDKHGEALIYFKKALELAPYSSSTHQEIFQTLKSLNKFEDHELFYKEFLDQNPAEKNCRKFYDSQAEALVEINEYSYAFECFKKALEICPNDAQIHFKYGIALYCQSCFKEALIEFERAVAISPRHKGSWNYIAFLKYHLGQIHEAIAVLEGLIENDLVGLTTFANMILFQYHLHQNEDVVQPYLEKLRFWVRSCYRLVYKFYTEDLELTEEMLQNSSDEIRQEFYLKKKKGIKLVLTLMNKLRT